MAATVSIITALYNHENFVGEAIESVLAQTYGDFELILWDDGSKDRSLEVARSYARKDPNRIKVYSHEDRGNQGQEATRNEALKVASGRYICLLDSDDLWLPRKLEQQVALMEARPEVGLVYAPVQALLHAHGKVLNLSSGPLPEGKVFDELVRSNFIHACSVMIRRECLQGLDAPFDTAYGAIGEYPLWLRIAKDWSVAPVAEPVAQWRVHGANTGTRRRIQGRRELVDLAARLAADSAYAVYAPAIAQAKNRYLYDLAVILAEEGDGGEDMREARRLFTGLAARKDPSFPEALRRKSRFMARLTSFGRPWVRGLKAAKFILLTIRDPRQAALVSSLSL